MKENKSIERIKSCMLMESICSSVYHLMSLNFPDERELWNALASKEESHAEIIAHAMESEPENYAEFFVPLELKSIRKTLDYANEIKQKLIQNNISVKEALEMVRKLYELKAESYHRDLLEKETEERVRQFFKRLLEIDKSNQSAIQAVMTKYGL